LFDRQKGCVVGGCLSAVGAVFVDLFHFLLLFLLLVTSLNYFFTIEGSFFVIFFTIGNFHKLLFTIERGKGNCFIIFIHCSGGGGAP